MLRTIKNDTYLSKYHLFYLEGGGDKTKTPLEKDFTIVLVLHYYGMAYRVSS